MTAASRPEAGGDPRIGSVLDGRFRVVGSLGVGGMGVVYRAVQLSVGREVALKVMTRKQCDLTSERFLREARLASRLSHPSIVTTYDCGRTGSGDLWIAMELLPGRSLRELLDGAGALPVDRALAIAEQLAAALASAHSAGVIHRDLKPSNVMILDDDRAVLLDFGLARGHRGDESLTDSGVVCGTPAYLAPEVALGHAAGPRSDVYALGLVLHEMIAGAHPFAAPTPEAQVSRSLNQPAPRLTAAPAAVAEAVQRMLTRNPAERCASAAIARAWLVALRAGKSAAPAAPAARLVQPGGGVRHLPVLRHLPDLRRLPVLRRLSALRALRVARAVLRNAWLVALPLAAAAVALAATYRSPRAHEYRGSYVSAGGPSCTRGTAWLRLEGDRLTGGAIAETGPAFEIVGVRRPSGTLLGAIARGDHPLGSFEGELRDGHARGTIDDALYGCTGSFDLAPVP